MTAENETPIESLESWLSSKPFWEQLVWKLNLENDSLHPEQLQLCYRYLLEHLGLSGPVPGPRPAISFRHAIGALEEATPVLPTPLRLLQIKDFVAVNALSDTCSLKLGPNLTLVYGGNATGKSGIARLLSNACFSRGEREILPDVRTSSPSTSPSAGATFVLDDAGLERAIGYSLGDEVAELRRFAVFDSKSVLIHLDQSNQVYFTPAQIKIFDKVADTISRLEELLASEANARRRLDPFQAMFLDDATSSTAVFCKAVSAETNDADLLRHIQSDPSTEDAQITALQAEIEDLRRLDIPRRRSQLAMERQNLDALKSVLQGILDRFNMAAVESTNLLVRGISEKTTLLQGLSTKSFDDGVLSSVGSAEWRSLIAAAKQVHELEESHGVELAHCPLCHQDLSPEAKALFEKYWQLLESKTEAELAALVANQGALLQDLKTLKATYPRFLPTDAGIRVLSEDDPEYLRGLADHFSALEKVLERWMVDLAERREVDLTGVSEISLARIDTILAAKSKQETEMVDPGGKIATLAAQLNSLIHRKAAASVKDAALEYLAFLRWSGKAGAVSFPGIKMAVTKKRTESVLVGVAQNYKGLFNQELARLGCAFDLVMLTSGDQGNTVREYRLDFAEDYSPSQILSEGEQNACSLADFLTEVQLDQNNCGVIFDDPVTSLDHERKDKIAARLADEASRRQVVVLTHDVMFMSQLVKHADRLKVAVITHWVRTVNGVPGCVEENSSPRLASVASLKGDSESAVKDLASLGAKEQERALGVALDYLRSACEALIEEVLFAGTIERYDDHVRVTNLEEVVFDKEAALRIVDLHGRLSEVLLAHNRSGTKGEHPVGLPELVALRKEFDSLEETLRELSKAAKKDRSARRDSTSVKLLGW